MHLYVTRYVTVFRISYKSPVFIDKRDLLEIYGSLIRLQRHVHDDLDASALPINVNKAVESILSKTNEVFSLFLFDIINASIYRVWMRLHISQSSRLRQNQESWNQWWTCASSRLTLSGL